MRDDDDQHDDGPVAGDPEAGGDGDAGAPRAAGFTRRALVARVAERTGTAPGKVSKVVQAVLEEMGLAVDRGEDLAVPPFGKMRRVREGKAPGQYVLKLRRPAGGARGPAEDDDDRD